MLKSAFRMIAHYMPTLGVKDIAVICGLASLQLALLCACILPGDYFFGRELSASAVGGSMRDGAVVRWNAIVDTRGEMAAMTINFGDAEDRVQILDRYPDDGRNGVYVDAIRYAAPRGMSSVIVIDNEQCVFRTVIRSEDAWAYADTLNDGEIFEIATLAYELEQDGYAMTMVESAH